MEHTIGSFISVMSFSIRLQVFVCIWFLASDIWKADLSGHLSITSWITWYQQKPSCHGEGLHDCWGRTFLRNLAGCWQVALSKLGVHNGFKYSFCRQFLWILWASWIFCVNLVVAFVSKLVDCTDYNLILFANLGTYNLIVVTAVIMIDDVLHKVFACNFRGL